MREQREPRLRLPAREASSTGSPRLDPRFRTHVVPVARGTTVPTAPPPRPPDAALPEPPEPAFELRLSADAALPTAAAIERAAAAAAISQRTETRPEPRPDRPRAVARTPPPAPNPAESRVPVAPAIGLEDLAPVCSDDWAVKVGEAAKMVDVVVVFYTAAHTGSEMFEFAFRTVVNELLPHLGRPYTVYRFSLDAEPGFLAEMSASLGLARDNPVTSAGFAWSGPGRGLLLLGDHALESPAMFQRSLRSLRRYLAVEPREFPRAGVARRRPAADFERVRPWGGRVLAVLAWCLFGTAALGAAVVGVAPQWASSLLKPASSPAPGPATEKLSTPGNAQITSISPSVGLENTTGIAPPRDQGQTQPAKPVKHARKKRTPDSLSFWGLPSQGTRTEPR